MTNSTSDTSDKRPPGPLTGLRVLDSAAVWAMPLAAAMLGDLGAEVIKVESTVRIVRGGEPYPNNEPTEDHFNRGGTFAALNRGKKSVTLNLGSKRGVELFKELVAKSDILIDNNRPGVMKRLGLDYPVLREVNPKLIHLSNSGYGQTGPWTEYGAIALALEPTTGMSALTGYRDGPPQRWNYLTDFPTGMMGVFAILGAIRHLRQTGEGQWIDLCMYEVGTALVGPEVMEYTANGHIPPRRGNRSPHFAQGCYPCTGEDRWVTISIRDDDDWAAFCAATGQPTLETDERYSTNEARLRNHDALDELIGAWTTSRDAWDVMRTLQGAGVPAGAVLNTRDMLADPQLHARGFWQVVGNDENSPVGKRPYATGGWKLSRTPARVAGPPATLGQHNEEILQGLLGVPAAEMAELEAADVIGTKPSPLGRIPGVTPYEGRIATGSWTERDADFEAHIWAAFEGEEQR